MTQFLGAFNDNLLKSALAIAVTFRLAAERGVDAATLVMIASGVFITPFFLFSGASGTLADRVDYVSATALASLRANFVEPGRNL